MKTFLFAAIAAAVSIAAAPAFAAEGSGNPFPHRVTGRTVDTSNIAQLPPRNTDPFPFQVKGAAPEGQMVPSNGSEGPVQSASSLPSGFENGTPAYEQAQSVENYLRGQAATRTAGSPVTQRAN